MVVQDYADASIYEGLNYSNYHFMIISVKLRIWMMEI